ILLVFSRYNKDSIKIPTTIPTILLASDGCRWTTLKTKNPVDACFYGVFGRFWTALENSVADRGGFEPPIRYSRIHAFQACAFNHSATCPKFWAMQSQAL